MTYDVEKLKKLAAKKAVEYVSDGMVLGLGTGSTTRYAIEYIGEMVKNGAELVGIPTSIESERLAKALGIPLADISEYDEIDLTIDGADEIDPELDLIKGLGGALVREKIVASISKQEIIIADERKVVGYLGEKAPLPVEVVRFGYKNTLKKLRRLGAMTEVRMIGKELFVSDNGNYIIDCSFPEGITNKKVIEMEINNIPGVVENGLFINLATKTIIAKSDGNIEIRER